MITCKYCNRRNSEDAELCKSCGAPFPDVTSLSENNPGCTPVEIYTTTMNPTFVYQADSTQATRAYVVQRGDSWAKIAKYFYGDPRAFSQLQSANKNFNEILREGVEITIPQLPGFDLRKQCPR